MSVSATGASLTVLGQTISGNFTLTPVQLPDNTPATAIAASDVSISLGTATAGVSMTNGQGVLLLTSSGLAGQLSGTVAVTLPGASMSGTFGVIVNTTANAVSTSVTLAGSPVAIDAPAGPYFELTATGAALTIAGQTLSGNFTIIDATSLTNGTILEIGVAGGSLSLGAGVVSVTGISGALFLEPTLIAGSLQATVAVNVPNVSLSGTFTAQFNTGTAEFTDMITVGDTTISLDVPGSAPGPTVELTGTNVSLTALGQTISGNFTIDSGAGGVTVTVTQLVADLGGTSASPLLVLSGGGSVTLTSGGAFGSMTVTVTLNGSSGVTFGGTPTFALDFNTTTAVQGALPAGPYVRVDATGLQLDVAGQALSGNIFFELTTDASGKTAVIVGISNGSVTLAGGAVSASQITGVLEFSPGAIAGTLSAAVAVTITGVSLTGTFTVTMNSGPAAVADSYEVGGTMVSLNVPAGPTFEVQVTNASLTIAGVTLTGSFLFEQTQIGTAPSQTTGWMLAVSNASLSLGDGTANFVSVNNINGAILIVGSGVAGQLTASVAVNLTGVSVSGSLSVELNTTTTEQKATFQLNNAPFSFDVPQGTSGHAYLELSGTGITLTIGSFSLSGNFTFAEGTTVASGSTASVPDVTVTLSNVSFSFGGGLVSIANGSGSLFFVSGGVYGAFSATLGFNVSSISASGGFEVEFNTTNSAVSVPDPLSTANPPASLPLAATTTVVSGSNDQLSVAGETLTAGSISMTATTSGGSTTVDLQITGIGLTITSGGTTYLSVTGGTVDLFVSSAGVAAEGTVTASLSLPSPITVQGSATFELEFNTGVTSHTFTGAGNTSVTVPAGPFLEVQVTGATLSFPGGLSISGNFVFEQNTEPSFSSSGTSVGSAPAAGTVSSVAVADVNGDGLPDIFVGVNGGASELFLNSKTTPGTYTLAPASDFPALSGDAVTAVALVDVNNDGLPDLIVATGGSTGQTQVFLNQGSSSGTWSGFVTAATQAWSTPYASSLAAGQLFGEGFNDLVVGVNTTGHSSSTSTSEVYENQGNNSTTHAWSKFNTTAQFTPGINTATTVAIGDVNGDNQADIVIATATTVSVFLQGAPTKAGGASTFPSSASATATTNGGTDAIALGDLNGDGFADLVVANNASPGVDSQYFLNQGNNTATPPVWQGFATTGVNLGTTAYDATSVALADVTGGGALDVILGVSNGDAQEFLNLGSTGSPPTWQGLSAPTALSGTTDAVALVLADVHNGSLPDIVSVGASGASATVNEDTAQHVTSIALSGLTLTLTSGSPPSTSTLLQAGQGAVVMLPDGIAGNFSGTEPGGSVSVSASVAFNSTPNPVDQTIVVNGVPIVVSFGPGQVATPTGGTYYLVSAAVGFNIAPVELNVSVTLDSTSHQATGTGSIFLGNGPAFINSGSTVPDNPNAQGVYLTNATFHVYDDGSGGIAVYATGTVGVVGIPGVTLSGTVTIEWNTTGSTYTGFAGISIPVQTLPEIGASNITLGLPGGISMSGGIDFAQSSSGGGFQIDFGTNSASNSPAQLQFPGLTIDASGSITVSSAGVVGLLMVSTSQPISLGSIGTLTATSISLGINTTSADSTTTPVVPANSIDVVAVGAISVLNQSIGGTFVFQQVQGKVAPGAPAGTPPPEVTLIAMSQVDLTFGTVTISSGVCSTTGAGVCVTGASGTLLLTASGLAGQLSGGVNFVGLGSATFTGNFGIAVNTTSAAVSQQFTVLGTTVTINVPAGPYFQISGTGVQLSLDGQSLTGNFQVTHGTIGSNTSVTEIAASNVSATFGDGSGGGVTLSNGSGLFVLAGTGFSGQIGGSVTLSVPGVQVKGTLNVQINTAGAVNDTIQFGTLTSSDGTQSVVLGDVNGDGLPDLIMSTTGGQVLEYLNDGQLAPFDGVTPSTIAAAVSGNVATLALVALVPGGPLDLVVANSAGTNEVYLNDAHGNFTADTASAAALGSDGTAVAAGDVNGDKLPDVVIANGGQIDLYTNAGSSSAGWSGFTSSSSTTLKPSPTAIGSGGSTVNALALVALTPGGPLDLIAATSGTNAVYSNDGTGTFTAVSTGASLGSDGTALAVGDVNGDGTPDVVIDNGGTVDVYISTVSGGAWTGFAAAAPVSGLTGATALALAGVTGSGSLDLIVASASGSNAVYANNGSGVFTLDSSVTLGSDGTAVAVADLTGNGDQDIIFGGGASSTATMVETMVMPAGPYLQVQGTNVSITVLGVQISGNFTLTETTLNNAPAVSATLTDGSITVAGFSFTDINGALLMTQGGVAADISLGTSLSIGSLSITGSISFELNTTSTPQQLTPTVEVPAGPFTAFSGNNLSITVSGFTLAGSFTFESETDSTGAKVIVVAVAGGMVTLNSHQVLTGVQGALVIEPGASGGIAGQLQGTVNLTGILPSSVTLIGTAGLIINQTGKEAQESLTVGGQTVSFDLSGTAPGQTTAGPYTIVSGTGMQLAIAGQTLSGNFSLETANGTDTLSASDVSLNIAGVVSLTNGAGNLTIGGSGVSGTISGTVSVTIPGVSVSGTISVTLDPVNGISVTGTNVAIDVLGQTITGGFGFTDTGGVETITFTDVKMSLGSGQYGVSLTDGNGNVTVSSAGVTGTVHASATFNLPTGFSIGATMVTIAFAPGSLQVQLTTSITVLGQTISGNFGFSQTTSNGSSVILITASQVGVCLGTNSCTGGANGWMGVSIAGGSAAVLITAAGAAGQISGGVTIQFGGGASVSATTATVTFNTSTSAVDQTYTLAGQTQHAVGAGR